MSEGTSQPADQPKHARAAQGTRRRGSQRTQQATSASPLAQEAAALLAAADTPGSAATQALPVAEAPVRSAPDAPPMGDRWGEFPTQERQAELKQRLEAWGQGRNHGDGPGPFADFTLTGADVYWLAARVAGAGDLAVGRSKLAHPPLPELPQLQLQGAQLLLADLQGAHLVRAQFQGANLGGARLQHATLVRAQFQGARLGGARLQHANLRAAQLQGAALIEAQLEHASLRGAHLQGADLSGSDLRGVDLRGAKLDGETLLMRPRLDTQMRVADVLWNGAPLMQLEWEQVPRLGDETQVHPARPWSGPPKAQRHGLEDAYHVAARAYRQLAVTLRGQGISEVADRFAYRALIMQRKALWWQLRSGKVSKLGAWLFSLFLAVLTGYGFRLWRIIVAYVLLILAFAGAYWGLDLQRPQTVSYWQAIILSVTAFHGRVFSNPFTLSDPQIVVTALEAIVGLVIEGVFIAMLTQRFFNR